MKYIDLLTVNISYHFNNKGAVKLTYIAGIREEYSPFFVYRLSFIDVGKRESIKLYNYEDILIFRNHLKKVLSYMLNKQFNQTVEYKSKYYNVVFRATESGIKMVIQTKFKSSEKSKHFILSALSIKTITDVFDELLQNYQQVNINLMKILNDKLLFENLYKGGSVNAKSSSTPKSNLNNKKSYQEKSPTKSATSSFEDELDQLTEEINDDIIDDSSPVNNDVSFDDLDNDVF